MTNTSKSDKRTHAHQRYYTADRKIVPGVTTILGVIAKPVLISWANRMGLAGIDTTKFVRVAADVGTICHEMIECELTGKEFDETQYSAMDIEKAQAGMIRFYDILRINELKNTMSELRLVSEKYHYGGTCDIYGLCNGKRTLIDIKTSNGIYVEHKIQVSAYRQLLEEHGYPVEQTIIARVGKEDVGSMELHYVSDEQQSLCFSEIFLPAQKIYKAMRVLSGQEREEAKRRKALEKAEAKVNQAEVDR